jgi:hypothetical protein
MSKKRTEPRRIRLAKIGVSWVTTGGRVHRDTGFMEDVTRTGVGLRARFALPIGFPLMLEMQDQVCVATVRHCKRDGCEFFMGIELDSPLDESYFGRKIPL